MCAFANHLEAQTEREKEREGRGEGVGDAGGIAEGEAGIVYGEVVAARVAFPLHLT